MVSAGVCMWRLKHKLFGWDYVSIKSPVMDYRYIRRLRTTADSKRYIVFSGEKIWFLLDNNLIDNGYHWYPLT